MTNMKNYLITNHRFPFCDVFVMREKKGIWELRDKQGRNTWSEEKYTTAQVLPFGASDGIAI